MGSGLLVRERAEQRRLVDLLPVVRQQPFLSRLYKVDAFRSKYLARMTEFSDRLFVPDRFMQQVGEIGPAIRPSIELEGEEWLAGFDQVASGRSGIVPFVTSRAAFVKAELEKGTLKSRT